MSTNARTAITRRISRETCLRIFLIFGPLVLLVALMRLLEYSFIIRTGIPPVGLLLSSAALTPFLLLLLSLGIYVWLRVRWPRLQPVWHAAILSLVTALLLAAASVLAPPRTAEWLSYRAFEVIRWDVLLLLLVALAFLFLLERTRGWTRILSLAALYVLVMVLMLVSVMAFGYLLSTGSQADGTLVKYFLLHISDLSGVVSSEAHGPRVLLLFLPLLILLLPAFLLRLPVVRRWASAAPSPAPAATPWHALWGALPVLLLLVLPPRLPVPDAFQVSSYAGLVEGMVNTSAASKDALDPISGSAPPFETQALRLVPTDSTRRLNVVVILLESTRARSTTPYQPDLDTTPFLDSLAQHALLVEQMYVVAPYTNKSLTPLLAGIYPYPHREMVEARPGAIPGRGLPGLLQPLGYRSAFFSPADLGYESKHQILRNLGFETTRGDGSYPTEGFEKVNYFGYEDRIVLEPSMDWVDARVAAGEPFFLTYLTLVAHHPYQVPSSFEQRDFGVRDASLNHYLNAVRYTDAFLHDLFRAFQTRRLLSSTLFIILGDHGQAFGEHMQRMHNDVIWEETLHVPAFLYNPLLFPEGGRIKGPRQQIDLLPTVADALGLRPEDGFYPGSSLLKPAPPGRTLYYNGWESNVAIALRRDSLKFMLRFQQSPMLVFDIDRDPREQHDLAADLPHARLQAVERELLLWRRSVQQVYQNHVRQIEQ